MDSISYTDILVNVVLAFIMLGVGMSLTAENFKNLFVYPRALIVGLTSQILILPLIAFTVSYFSNMPLAFKVGLIILAACPGGTTSGIIVYLFKGNVALSVTFTSFNSIITLFTIPLIVNLSLLYFFGRSESIHLSYIETIIEIFSITIIPAILGILIRKYKPVFASKAQKPLKYLLLIALAVVFMIFFLASKESGGTGITLKEIFNILPYALLLNVACMVWGYASSSVAKIGIRNSYTIGVEASVHNTTLAMVIAGTLLDNQDMVKPALIYAMFSFWTAIAYSYIIRKLHGLKTFPAE